MIQHEVCFYVRLDDGTENVFNGAAIVDAGQVYIPFAAVIDHLGLNARKSREKRDELKLPVHHYEVKRGNRAQPATCLHAQDMQAFLLSLTLTKIRPVERARIVGSFVTDFVAKVMTQCVTKPEPDANPPVLEIYERSSDIGIDALRRDLVRDGMPPEYINTAIELNQLHYVRETMYGLNPNVKPGTLHYDIAMKRMGRKEYTLFHLKPEEYRAGAIFEDMKSAHGGRQRVLSFAKLADENPEHELVEPRYNFKVSLPNIDGRDITTIDPTEARFEELGGIIPEPWHLQRKRKQ